MLLIHFSMGGGEGESYKNNMKYIIIDITRHIVTSKRQTHVVLMISKLTHEQP